MYLYEHRFLKKIPVFKIPNSIHLSVSAVQNLKFSTVHFLHLKSENTGKSRIGSQASQSPSRMAGPAAVKIILVQHLGNNSKDIFPPSRLKQISSTEREEKLRYLPVFENKEGRMWSATTQARIPRWRKRFLRQRGYSKRLLRFCSILHWHRTLHHSRW